MDQKKYAPPVKPLKKSAIPAQRRKAEKAAVREGGIEPHAHEADEPMDEDERQSAIKAALANTVAGRIREAMQARQASGIDELWAADDDQYNGIDDVSINGRTRRSELTGAKAKTSSDGRSKVFLNITKPKTQAAVARVKELLIPSDDKPWDIGPTPIPEMGEEAEREPDRPVTLSDGTIARAEDVVAAAVAKAKASAEGMSRWIEDKFVEGSVYAHLRQIIEDAGRLGTGVVKGPFAVARKSRKWTTDRASGITALEVLVKNEPTSRRIDPRDAFPDPSCGEDIHAGSYFVERDFLTARGLRDLALLDDYDTGAILAALMEGPQGRGRDRDAARTRDRVGESSQDSEVFEVFYYYGDCTPEDLLAMGAELGEDELYLGGIPAVVTMLNNRAIKAVVNPMETGEFPYDFFPWEPVADQPWGRGVPNKMATAQVILNSAVRALLENAGLSAGVQIAITEGALVPVNGKYEITGRKLWKFKPTDILTDVNKAMAVFKIPSVQEELSAIIQFALTMADELTNLPQLLQGQNNREGEVKAPQTLGGMSMLMNAANAPLRVLAKQFDDYVIVRHLRRYYDWGMQSPDVPNEHKGDHQIKALGSTSMMQRDAGREFLLQAYGMVADPEYMIDKARLSAETARAYGYDFARIQFPEDEQKVRRKKMAESPPPTDPQIETAHIRNEAVKAKIEADRQDADLDRQHDLEIQNIKFQIQAMEFAGQKEITMEQLRAMLATKTLEHRAKTEEMRLKLAPENRSGLGI